MAIQQVRAQINGVWHTLDYNSTSGKYEKSITAPNVTSYNVNTGHYYPVTVEAKNTAGTTTTVTIQGVLDTSAPQITAVEIVPNPVDAGATMIVKVTVTG